MNQVKVPNRVQSVFLYTISGVKKKILLELKHGGGGGGEKKQKKPQGQLQIACEKHYFHVSLCPKMNVLEGQRKSEGEKKTLNERSQSFKNARP